MPIPEITVEDIEKVYPIPDGIDPEAFIEEAEMVVGESPNMPYSDLRLKKILINLTVHFIMAYEPQSMKYEDVSLNAKSFGEQLKSTPYGQKVLGFDYLGYLAGFGLKKARMYSVGGRRCV